MCSKLCEILAVLTLGGGLLSISMILISSPALITVFLDRSQLLENQFQLFDTWAKQSLRQKHKFYFLNITGGDRFLRSDTPMTVDEIGPFVYDSEDFNWTTAGEYNLSSLSLAELRFNLNESAGDESVSFYALDVPQIRRLASKPHSLLSIKDLVRQTTVRDILGEIMDGLSGISKVKLFPENDVSKELHVDASSSYLQYLRNELCLRLFKVIKFANPPTTAKSGRFFQKLPCDCLVVVPNGTEKMSRDNPKYTDILTSKYFVLWDDKHCAVTSSNPCVPIGQDRYVSKNLFSVSSVGYWKEHGFVQYDHEIENSSETRIKVEQFSDVITDFSFEYQLNIPIKFRGEKFLGEQVKNYPVLRAVTSGVSMDDVDSSIYNYIIYPRERISKFNSDVKICVICFSISICAALYLWAFHRISARISQ